MSLLRRSKSGLFLLELLLNLLLFCLLCGCALLFFIKSHRLSENATMLQNAVQITSSLAGIYETDENGLSAITKAYPLANAQEKQVTVYYDEEYHPCSQDAGIYYVVISSNEDTINSANIDFYSNKGEPFYSITACNYSPATPKTLKEVVSQ